MSIKRPTKRPEYRFRGLAQITLEVESSGLDDAVCFFRCFQHSTFYPKQNLEWASHRTPIELIVAISCENGSCELLIQAYHNESGIAVRLQKVFRSLSSLISHPLQFIMAGYKTSASPSPSAFQSQTSRIQAPPPCCHHFLQPSHSVSLIPRLFDFSKLYFPTLCVSDFFLFPICRKPERVSSGQKVPK